MQDDKRKFFFLAYVTLDWLQSLKQFFINMSIIIYL